MDKIILQLLNNIRSHPIYYLGDICIFRLHAFIDGCIEYRSFEKKEETAFLNSFLIFIANKYKNLKTLNWASIIFEAHPNQQEAFYKFYEHFDEFMKQYEYYKLYYGGEYMQKIEESIEMIRKCPFLYLGKISLGRLYAFLSGSLHYRNSKKDDACTFFAEFEEFIKKKYDKNATKTWEQLILNECPDDEKALYLFFDLYDEFLNEAKQ